MPGLPDAPASQHLLIVTVDRHRLAPSIAPARHAFKHPDLTPARRQTTPGAPRNSAGRRAGDPDFTTPAWDNLTRRARDGTPELSNFGSPPAEPGVY
jgi:hypothetical protein